MISNELVEFETFATAYIIGGSLVAYQKGYVVDRCPWQSKDLGSSTSAVESVFFSTERFQIL